MLRFGGALLLTALTVALLDAPLSVRIWSAILLVALPAAALAQARILAREDALPVLPAYVSTLLFLIVLGAVTWLVADRAGLLTTMLGTPPAPGVTLAWAAGVTTVAFALIEAGRALGMRETRTTRELLPSTPAEKGVYILVSSAAGVSEELAYRGLLPMALAGSVGTPAAVVLSALAFGLVHGYQAGAGVLRATMLGLLLSLPVLLTGSLLPGMIAHAGIDLLAGLVFANRFRA